MVYIANWVIRYHLPIPIFLGTKKQPWIPGIRHPQAAPRLKDRCFVWSKQTRSSQQIDAPELHGSSWQCSRGLRGIRTVWDWCLCLPRMVDFWWIYPRFPISKEICSIHWFLMELMVDLWCYISKWIYHTLILVVDSSGELVSEYTIHRL